jgi:tetratricopeptide (TPR) repeat protein
MNGTLRRQAIHAAKTGNWAEAATLNKQILEQHPEDTSAFNRLGIAYVQLGEINKAKKAFKEALKLDQTNIIAKKHLDKLENNQELAAPSFAPLHFIEEPGKTKTVDLHRLANKQTLEKLAVGKSCELKQKNRYISVEVDGMYIGALPEDISFRLGKLIANGNRYSCTVRSANGKSCSVYIKEMFSHPKNKGVQSFPGNKNAIAQLQDIDESYLIHDDIPMEIVDTDRDIERSLDDMGTDDIEE